MTERDYAIRSFKEITLNAARHTEERMDLYYEKMKALMNNYQDLILENQMVLDELEQECQEKINENIMMCFIAASAGTEKWRTWKLCLNWG